MDDVKKQFEQIFAHSSRIDTMVTESTKNNFGVVDARFLAQSVSLMATPSPSCILESDPISKAVNILQNEDIGCVLVTDTEGKLRGIFGERDYISRVHGDKIDLDTTPVGDYMTSEPVSIVSDSHVAYALNLMSNLGFRHVPVVDQEGCPIAVLSIRDIVDYLVKSFTDDLEDILK